MYILGVRTLVVQPRDLVLPSLSQEPVKVANRIAVHMGVPPNFTQSLYEQHQAEVDGNSYNVTVEADDDEVIPTLNRLRELYEPHVR